MRRFVDMGITRKRLIHSGMELREMTAIDDAINKCLRLFLTIYFVLLVYLLWSQTKGTTSFGKRHTKTHTGCRRCGKVSFHKQKKECSCCGYPQAKIRSCKLQNTLLVPDCWEDSTRLWDDCRRESSGRWLRINFFSHDYLSRRLLLVSLWFSLIQSSGARRPRGGEQPALVEWDTWRRSLVVLRMDSEKVSDSNNICVTAGARVRMTPRSYEETAAAGQLWHCSRSWDWNDISYRKPRHRNIFAKSHAFPSSSPPSLLQVPLLSLLKRPRRSKIKIIKAERTFV